MSGFALSFLFAIALGLFHTDGLAKISHWWAYLKTADVVPVAGQWWETKDNIALRVDRVEDGIVFLTTTRNQWQETLEEWRQQVHLEQRCYRPCSD